MTLQKENQKKMRSFHITLFGATGFTGQQLAALVDEKADPKIKIAIAGRNLEKLQEISANLSERVYAVKCDAFDVSALDELAKQSQVVLSTAGPFAKMGTGLFAACAKNGTHYADITGETLWVKDMIDQFHDEAKESGACLIPFCGFDSIPADLSCFYAALEMQKKTNSPLKKIFSTYRLKAGINGGTAASAIHMLRTGDFAKMQHPFLLNAQKEELAKNEIEASADLEKAIFHKESQRWLAPFFMAPVNTRVVRRGQSLAQYEEFSNGPLQKGKGYGENFQYQEAMVIGKGTAKKWTAKTMGASTFLMNRLPSKKILPALLEKVAPTPGQGPSKEVQENAFAQVDAYSEAEDGTLLHTRFFSKGDPSNFITVHMLASVGLAFLDAVSEKKQLPAGVLTPALSFGNEILHSLREVGMIFEIIEK